MMRFQLPEQQLHVVFRKLVGILLIRGDELTLPIAMEAILGGTT